jgi:hypothetical protein
VSKDIVIKLESWIKLNAHLFLSSETAFRDALHQLQPSQPILKVQDGLRCTSEKCSYHCLKPGAMATHWSDYHKGKRAKKKSKKVKVQQTFSESHPRYCWSVSKHSTHCLFHHSFSFHILYNAGHLFTYL